MYKILLYCTVAVASASAIAPLGLAGAGWGSSTGYGLAAPLRSPVVPGPVLGAYNYRGPLSLAPGQPANILAPDGRPLDTLSVNLDRAAHFTAKAVEGAHNIGKRSALVPVGPVTWSTGVVAPVPLAAVPLAAVGGAAHWGHVAPWGVRQL